MSILYQTTGIVLSRRDYREADRWYSAYTPDRGKVEFLARGGSKALAKLTPHLEMAAEVNLLLVYGRHYQTLAGADRKRSFQGVYTDISKHLLAQNAMHLVDIGTTPFENDPHIYQLLCDWLVFLEQVPSVSRERAGFLLGAFTLKLLAMTGYRPELQRCLGCRSGLQSKAFRWHALKGGVVCEHCFLIDAGQWFSARPMTDEVLKLIRFSLEEHFQELLKLHLTIEGISGFHDSIESLVISHFPTIPASSLRASCLVC